MTGIPAAFLVVAVIMALFAAGYVAMTRRVAHPRRVLRVHIPRTGQPGRRRRRSGRPGRLHVPADRPVRGTRASRRSRGGRAPGRVPAPWWEWALAAWVLVTVLGQLRVDITGKVLGVLLTAEVAVVIAETIGGLAHPAGGHLSLAPLSPAALTSAGFGTFGVLAVVAVLGFVGFETGSGLSEEARTPAGPSPPPPTPRSG